MSIFQSAADVMNLLMNDNGRIKYQQLYFVEAVVIVPLTFVGLIVVNGILSNFQSQLTLPVLEPQIKTLEDVYNSPLRITTESKFMKKIIVNSFSNRTGYKNWDSKVIVEEDAINKHITVYDRTISVIDTALVSILLSVQKRLNIKGYHNTRIQITDLLFSYAVDHKFLYFERRNDIIHRIQSAGLYWRWLRTDYAAVEANVLKINSKRLNNSDGTNVGKFEFPMFIVYGWLVGGIVFIFEIVWKKYEGIWVF